jgi:hypothetical protein
MVATLVRIQTVRSSEFMHRFSFTLNMSAEHDNGLSCRSGGYFHRSYFLSREQNGIAADC